MSGTVIDVPPRRRSEIRALATQLRQLLDLDEPYFPIVQVLELALPTLVPGFLFEVLSADELGPDHGQTFPDDGIIRLREDVYIGACEGRGRDRMTAAHELGHLLLHRGIPMARRVGRESVPPYRSSEWQANCFGGELLFAAKHADRYKSSLEAACACGITEEAASIQLRAYRKDGLIA